MKNNRIKSNIIINSEDKYNLLKDGPDYENYSKNYVEDELKRKCHCNGKCKKC